MKHTYHIQNVNRPCGSTHNRIVKYASFANVIRYALPKMPPGQYMIYLLDPYNIYREPLESRPAYRRVTRNEA